MFRARARGAHRPARPRHATPDAIIAPPLPIQPATRLGPYKVVAPLGAGGMGEVYRAHDTRLQRDVAIKVLRGDVGRDASRLQRFEQEARAAAALNHPNIVAVFDIGVEGETPYVVSELLEGETLRSMLARGPLPQRTAFDLAIQTARGMAAAHRRGIVHRDLKPENVFVTTDGRAKILDFGLAKLTERLDVDTGAYHSVTALATMPGMVLGTAGYMSPEQVRGEATDARTDIFAFGSLLYEMLSARRAFAGDSAVETMTAILRSDPFERLPSSVSPGVARLMRRCLEKQPAQRFQSADDIAFALEALAAASPSSLVDLPGPVDSAGPIASAPGSTSSASTPAAEISRARRPTMSRRVAIAAGALALLGAGAIVGVLGPWNRQEPAPVATFLAQTFDRLPVTAARFMPDGQTIVYSAAPAGFEPELFVINAGAEGPQPLGVKRAQLLSVSSKGELALIVNASHVDQRLFGGTLARMTIGSSPRELAERVREADWAPDGGSLAIIRDVGNGRDRLEFPLGTTLYEASGYLSDPRVSPDGTRVAFFEHPWRYDDRGWLKVVDRQGGVTTLGAEFWGLQGIAWTADGGTIVFSGSPSGGGILQPFSTPATGSRAPRAVLGVPGRFIVHDIARDGRWLAVREDLAFGVRVRAPGQDGERELSWLGSSGARSISADGRWLLMVDVGAGGGKDYGVVMRRTDARQTIRLGDGSAQRLSPDGKWAGAILSTPARVVLYPTGPGQSVTLPSGTLVSYSSMEWFPDSARVLVCGAEAERAPRCFEQDAAGKAPPRALTDEGVLATLAPDGRTLLLTLPDGSSRLASVDGGTQRTVTGFERDDRQVGWSTDSRAVFVQRGIAVPAIVDRVDLASGTRETVARLFPAGESAISMIYVTDWARDGEWYAYNYTTVPSTLFVVSGARP